MSDGREEAMIAGLTIDEHDALKAGMRSLPDTMPPRIVWEQIREQAQAEGLLAETRKSPGRQWFLGAGLAAAVAVVAIAVPTLMTTPVPDEPSEVVPSSVPSGPATRLNVLRAQSSELEGELAAMPAEPRVIQAGTAATIEDITARIAAIDFQLSHPEVELSPEEEEIFWRERVRLMQLLVSLRYAQTQRAAF